MSKRSKIDICLNPNVNREVFLNLIIQSKLELSPQNVHSKPLICLHLGKFSYFALILCDILGKEMLPLIKVCILVKCENVIKEKSNQLSTLKYGENQKHNHMV